MTLLLRIYLGLSVLVAPLWRAHLRKRIHQGKEDAARLAERLGQPSAPRPDGPLLWVHALSVGEGGAMIAPLRALKAERPDLVILFTTGTRTGAEALVRMGLPDGVIHQYLPLDLPGPVTRFLDYWRPDAFVLAEQDLWPRIILSLHARKVPMAVINARLTDRRFKNRMRMRSLHAPLWAMFRQVLVQDAASVGRMVALGAHPDRVRLAGLLKAAAAPLPDAPDARAALEAAIGTRPVWIAAATEGREHAGIVAAHTAARKALPDLLLVLAPRHPRDADQAAALCAVAFGHPPPRRSNGAMPAPSDAVWLADTIGEMGLVYRLAPVAFVGHSLLVEGEPPLSGKNPFEAAALGRMVLHGPAIGNFAESYAALTGAGATQAVADAEDLAARLPDLLADPAEIAARGAAGQRMLAEAGRALDETLGAIRAILPPAADAGSATL